MLRNVLPFALLFSFLFLTVTTRAQLAPPCPGSNAPGAESCAQACVFCDFTGFSGTTSGYTASNNVQGFCGQVENDVWIAFVAGASTLTLTVTPSNCSVNGGLQAALYANCTDAPLICGGPTGPATPVVLNATNLNPGTTYYLMVDGWVADDCDFTVSVSPAGAASAPAVGAATAISGPSSLCPGAVVEYSIAPVPGAGAYTWTAPPGWLIDGQPGPRTLFGPAGASPTITVGTQGGIICVTPANSCSSGTPVCKTVSVQPIPATVLPPLTLCAEDAPFVLSWGQSVSTSGMYQTTFTSYLGCDSVVRQHITFKPPLLTNIGVQTICSGECFTICGQDFCTPGAYTAVCTSFQGCDSLVSFMLAPVQAPTRGAVFYDFDGNGQRTAGEPYAAGVEITTSGGAITQTGSSGQYVLPTIAAGDTIFIELPGNASGVQPAFHVFDPAQPTCYNFGLIAAVPPAFGTGKVFYDLDGNGVFSAGDVPAAGVMVRARPNLRTLTAADGTFGFSALLPGDTLRVQLPGASSVPAFRIYVAGQTTGYDFALPLLTSGHDLAVDLTNLQVFRQGFTTQLKLTVRNILPAYIGPTTVCVALPYQLDFIGASPSPSLTTAGDTLCWELGTLGPAEERTVMLTVKTILGVPNNATFDIPAWVEPLAGDLVPASNSDVLHATVVGSYDPNDKRVEPAYMLPAFLSAGQPLEYTIRFQNTGNYPADVVRITDTLSADLDAASFRFVSASHPCTYQFVAPRVIEFVFDAINLPDSLNNEPESHGFVKFSIAPAAGLPFGATVENFSDIYFDFNPPVRTNTATSQYVYFVPTQGVPPGGEDLSIRPNPASYRVECSWPQPTAEAGRIWLVTAAGVPVQEVAVPEGSIYAEFYVAEFANGLYLVVLEAGGMQLQRQLVVSRFGPVRRQ
jgi:uncharacterized repeat protein (TIGR01451 family)